MKRAVVVGLLCVSITAFAKKPPQPFPTFVDSRLVAFEGVTWGMSKKDTFHALLDNGWRKEGALLRSKVNGVRLAAFFTFDRYGNLVAVRAEHMSVIGYSTYRNDYDTLRELLRGTYGEPDEKPPPYSEADLPIDTWTRADGTQASLGIRLEGGNVSVWFSYTSPQFLKHTLSNSLDFKTELAPWAP
jgi:hypothetical protein